MSKIWFTSDWHFGHDKSFLYEPRGFSSIAEANEVIMNRHNELVSNDDEVYVLGDLMLGDNNENIEYIKRMNGRLHIIIGNHDTSERIKKYKECDNVVSVLYADRIKWKKWSIYVSHCPMIVAHNEEAPKLWNFHGHTHSKEKFSDIPHCYNVALDAHNCYPIEIEQIAEDIRQYLNKAG